MRKSKVIWTDIEVDAMAMQLVADLFGAVPEPGLNEITKAQRVLPEDRRRKCTGISQCKNVWARFQQMWAEAAAGKQTTPAAIEPTPAPEPVVEALPAGLDAFDTVVLLAEVLKRLSSHRDLEARIATLEAARQAPAETQPPPQPPVVLPKPQPQIPEAKPPKANVEHGLGVLDAALDSATQKCLVYLVGPMPGQFQEIKHRCAGMKRVQLVFLDKDKSPYVPRTAKHVLLTQHTPHKWWDAARSAAGADNVKFIHGGINAVCDAVAEIYRNLEKTTK